MASHPPFAGIDDQVPFARALLPEGSLLEVASSTLVKRYNECLERLGIEPTGLKRFHVDRAGWSLEVASEQGDPYYLSAGVANPMAVILSPDQRDLPMLFPFNSYDGRMLSDYFERFRYEIPDITRSSCIGLDIDHELTQYETALDLLLVEYIIVRTLPGELSSLAGMQKKLVNRLLADERSWFDRGLRGKILQSARIHGDLRFRTTEVPDWKFDAFRSFHTRAFGGVFVIRPQEQPPFLVLEDSAALGDYRSQGGPPTCFALDCELLPRLEGAGLITLDLQRYRNRPELLSVIRDELAAELLAEHDPDLKLDLMTAQQRKQLVREMEQALPDTYHELERLAKRLLAGSAVDPGELSAEIKLLLVEPVPHLLPSEKELIAQLLLRLRPWDVWNLYRQEPGRFATDFAQWTRAKKRRVLATIANLPAGAK